jgi:hypothetical protein
MLKLWLLNYSEFVALGLFFFYNQALLATALIACILGMIVYIVICTCLNLALYNAFDEDEGEEAEPLL